MRTHFIISTLLLQVFIAEAGFAQKSPTSTFAPNPNLQTPVVSRPKKIKETTEAEDIVNEFKDTKFLQVDRLEVPKELKIIQEQIKENAIDVIINSKTHTPVFAQKKSDGYSENYKKFHGLEVKILPIPNQDNFYSLHFFYYNWTNNKADKKLNVKISKYNVLNELRFGLYELLLGKKFVIDNKEKIEKQNFDRIQAVRKGAEEREKEERKKQKEKKKLEEELEEKKALQEQAKIKREERERANKEKKSADSLADDQEKSDNLGGSQSEDQEQEDDEKSNNALDSVSKNNIFQKNSKKKSNQNSSNKKENSSILEEEKSSENKNLEPIPLGDSIPTKSDFAIFGSVFEDQTNSVGIIKTTTYLRYFGFGARYKQEQETDSPRGMRFSIKAGVAIKKDDYEVPVFRAFEAEVYKGNFFEYFKVFAGLDYFPVNFVNLPVAGEGLKFFENDIFWGKVGSSFSPVIFEKKFELRTVFLKSLMASSNQKKSFSGNSLIISAYYQQNEKYGLELGYQQTYLSGDLEVDSKSMSLAFVYRLEN